MMLMATVIAEKDTMEPSVINAKLAFPKAFLEKNVYRAIVAAEDQMVLLVMMTFNVSVLKTSKGLFVMSAMITRMAISLTVYLVNVMKLDLLALIVVRMEHVCAKMVTMEQNAMSALLDLTRHNQENVACVSNRAFLVY